MKTRILPYQTGGELVFILVRGSKVARWPIPPMVVYGIAPIDRIGPTLTLPTIELAMVAISGGMADCPSFARWVEQ